MLVDEFSERELIHFVEEVFPEAEHCMNFWVGRKVLYEEGEENLGKAEIFEWQIEGIRKPSLRLLKILALLSPEKIRSAKVSSLGDEVDARLQKVDRFVSNPLRWGDLSDEDREEVAEYRRELKRLEIGKEGSLNISWPEEPEALRRR